MTEFRHVITSDQEPGENAYSKDRVLLYIEEFEIPLKGQPVVLGITSTRRMRCTFLRVPEALSDEEILDREKYSPDEKTGNRPSWPGVELISISKALPTVDSAEFAKTLLDGFVKPILYFHPNVQEEDRQEYEMALNI